MIQRSSCSYPLPWVHQLTSSPDLLVPLSTLAESRPLTNHLCVYVYSYLRPLISPHKVGGWVSYPLGEFPLPRPSGLPERGCRVAQSLSACTHLPSWPVTQAREFSSSISWSLGNPPPPWGDGKTLSNHGRQHGVLGHLLVRLPCDPRVSLSLIFIYHFLLLIVAVPTGPYAKLNKDLKEVMEEATWISRRE